MDDGYCRLTSLIPAVRHSRDLAGAWQRIRGQSVRVGAGSRALRECWEFGWCALSEGDPGPWRASSSWPVRWTNTSRNTNSMSHLTLTLPDSSLVSTLLTIDSRDCNSMPHLGSSASKPFPFPHPRPHIVEIHRHISHPLPTPQAIPAVRSVRDCLYWHDLRLAEHGTVHTPQIIPGSILSHCVGGPGSDPRQGFCTCKPHIVPCVAWCGAVAAQRQARVDLRRAAACNGCVRRIGELSGSTCRTGMFRAMLANLSQ